MTAVIWGVTFKYGKGEFTGECTENKETWFWTFKFFFKFCALVGRLGNRIYFSQICPARDVTYTLSPGRFKLEGSMRNRLESQYNALYKSVQRFCHFIRKRSILRLSFIFTLKQGKQGEKSKPIKKQTRLSACRLHDTTHLTCVVTSLKPTVLALEWAVAELRVFGCFGDGGFEMVAWGTNLTRLWRDCKW
jgi:hypothetical protein